MKLALEILALWLALPAIPFAVLALRRSRPELKARGFPIVVLNRRRRHFHWSELVSPANDTVSRCIAVGAANDDGWQGRTA